MIDTATLLSDYVGLDKYSDSEIITPMNIVSDMVDLLPAEIFSPDTTFLDPAVKSGRFLLEIHYRLMASDTMKSAFPDKQKRHEHIIHNLLYGLATSEFAAMVARKTLYGSILLEGNIRHVDDYYNTVKSNGLPEIINKEFNSNMKFDVVIGNPPYNNDLYLDFVTQGHQLSKEYDVWITPAKWQAKGGKKNEDFRKNIVPHMGKIVFYPDSLDVFCISEPSGISYYLICKTKQSNCEVKNKSALNSIINCTVNRSLQMSETLWNYGNNIVKKIYENEDYKPYQIREVLANKKYTININKQLLNCLSYVWDWEKSCIKREYAGKGGYVFDRRGKAKVFGNPKLITDGIDNHSGTSINLFTTDDIDEAKSFLSWAYSKFVQFLILINRYAQNMMNDIGWRFVPDPGPFDHIFTDEELYQKYNLTQEEINIIESVIKERK